MASFDFIDAASKGYEFVWRERAYLFRVAIPVIFIKIACLLSIFVLGIQEQFLRQGLVLMPSIFVEAIFVVGLIRFYIYREPIFIFGKYIPMPEIDTAPDIYRGHMSRKQCFQGGVAMYLLIQIVLGGLSAALFDYAMLHPVPENQPSGAGHMPPLFSAVMVFIIIGAFVKGFRLLWLYIPISMGYKASDFFVNASGWRAPLAMVGLCFICALPAATLFSAGLSLISGAFTEGSSADIILRAILQSVGEIVISSILVVSMTFGIRQILFGTAENK